MGLLKNNFSTFKENLNFLQGTGPDPNTDQQENVIDLGGGTAGGGTRAAGPGNTPASNTQTTPPMGVQAQASAPTTAPGTSGSILDRLYGGIGGDLSAAREGLGAAKNAFYAAAGPSRSYQSTGAEKTLGAAIEPGASSMDLAAARGYLGANYGGPTGLHTDETAKTEDAIARLYQTGQALGQGSGLYGLLRTARPNLTQGMAKAEAQSLLFNPEYRRRLAETAPQTEQLQKDLTTAQTEASDFAKQRQAEEQGIADSSKKYLQGRESAIEAIGEQEIQKRNAERSALENLYKHFRDTGDLSGLPEETRKKFQTQVTDEGKAAQAKWDEILGNYQDIKDVPLLQIRMTGKGKEARELPADYKNQLTGPQWQRVVERQNELSKWFDPGSHYQEAVNTGFGGAPGNYAGYKPLYFNGDQNLLDTEVPTFGGGPKDFQNYAHFDPGAQATLSNQLSGDDISRLNSIKGLLGEGGELTHDDAPFRQAQIAVEADQFLGDQIRMLEEQKGNLSRQSKDYLDELHKTRKDFRKAERKAKWAKISRILNEVVLNVAAPGVGSLLYEGGRATPGVGKLVKGNENLEANLAANLFS